MITGLLFYVPLTIYGYVRLQSGQSPVATAIIAFAVGDAINSGPRPFTADGLGERRWNDLRQHRPARAMASGSARWAPGCPLLLNGAELLLSKLTKQVSQGR
jgi:hypothetical protein